ncbi:hypothetical protein BAS06_06665 [Elizabethkingia miricola]|uniref:hypothetical protein n=1 Tax=Weeksellaceae TaxID=2762318 RepID=UPI00099AC56D|nr:MULTISPECIES: hypothetical protein [Weeksellaceae]MCT3745948.1 hypothetical protein [Elizabethkingia anophelis]MDC8024573.1 hypothetical protein [Elizabethkingia anophelis]MDV3492895.1 hypothetical protein [Elizabethkingia anophelis]MDV4129608.1 hypothetical protein [Elizabethkingia anophelis]MDV4133296.1 hypothetical protein [Elizabethkingia anophelis]
MKAKISTILFSGAAVLATGAVFTLSVKDSSLESLRANALAAGTKCISASNSDCLSPSTGNIYTGYKAGTIGGKAFEEELAN